MGPRVLALVGGETGPTLWRTFQPFAELCRRGEVAEWVYLDDSPKAFPLVAMGVFEAIILPRLSWKTEDRSFGQNWINSLRHAGLTVIYEVDDDVFTPQIGARQHATTEPNRSLQELEDIRRARIAAIRLADGVTTSNERLARVIRQYVAVDTPVCVVPNSVDIHWWRMSLRNVRRLVAPLTIGWSGGARYAEDLEPIAEAWAHIARHYPHVTFVVQGFMADVLVRAVPAHQVRRIPWYPLEHYPRALKNIDIGCASVADIHFNHCKTPIKVWEYTMAGATSVVSPTLYEQVVTDEEDGLIASTALEWEVALARLIEDRDLRRRLWRAQRRRVAEHHSLQRNVWDWSNAWAQIIGHTQRQRTLGLAG